MKRSFLQLTPSLLLLLAAGSIAAAVNHYAAQADSDRAARPGTGFGNPAIRIQSEQYPRQAIDSDSFVVRIARPARRIVSQYWALDEYVYSIVPPERVVAVSATAYVEAVSNVYTYVQQFHPAVATDPERVLRLDPDLLMVSDSSRADFCAIVRTSGVPIYRTFTAFATLSQVAAAIRLTGYLTGEDRTARVEEQRFWNEIRRAQAKRRDSTRHPRILGLGGMFSYGSGTLFDDIVHTLGGRNVGAEGGLEGYNEVNGEQIVRWNPEWIIAGADKGQSKQVLSRLLADPEVSLTQAAKQGHIVVFENNIFLPMSPFTRLFVSALAEALYG
jgi:iron complex transport system substrate-binding protein